MAPAGNPTPDRDSRGPAQVVALGALVVGVALMVYGIVDDALAGTSGDPARTAFVAGAALATFGALLALLAPGLFLPGAGPARRFAQVAVPAFVVAAVCPAVAVLASSALGSGEAAATAPVDPAVAAIHGGHDAAGGVPLTDVQALQGALSSAVSAAPGTTSPAGQAPTAGMAPVSLPPGAAGGSLEDQLGAILAAEPTTVPATPSATPPPTTVASPTAALSTAITSQHVHGVAVPEQPLDRATRAELGQQLTAARAAALAFPTVADAEKAGYVKVTGYLPLIGAHYVNWSLMDGTFDVDHPEMLLYDGTSPDSRIVGLSYYVFSPSEPAGFAGPNDHWHQHIGLCLRDGVVVGGEGTSPAECAARGGTKVAASNGWMVHAWVVPGWESPQGVFSPEHPGLT